MNSKAMIIPVIALIGLLLTACGASTPTESSNPVTNTQQETPTASVAPSEEAVATKAVELFRLTVADDPSTDEEVVAQMKDKGEEIVAFMDAGGTSSEFLKQEAANDPTNVVRNQALLTGAIALNPSISQHENY